LGEINKNLPRPLPRRGVEREQNSLPLGEIKERL